MTHPDLQLGRSATLTLHRLDARQAILATDDGKTVPLPVAEVPPEAAPGDPLRAFVHQDADGRTVATTRVPKLERGEVVFLTATRSGPSGAFFDWGLAKPLWVPRHEQIVDVEPGARHPVGLVLADGRLIGTLRVAELLDAPGRAYEVGQTVAGEAWRNDPDIGLFVIVERRFVGLLPATEPHRCARGEAGRFRVSRVLPDGKVDLTLRGPAHAEIERDGERILAVLAGPSPPRVNDKSSPDEIRQRFGLAKKAFKRAAGRLLAERAIEIDGSGWFRIWRQAR